MSSENDKNIDQQILEASQVPQSLAEGVKMAVNRMMGRMHVSMPGQVQNFYPADGTADIQPLLMKKFYLGGGVKPYDLISKVPILYMGPSNGWMRFPLKEKDPGLLIFSDRSLENWWTEGGQVDPGDTRMFNISDAIFIPGLRSQPETIVPKGAPTSMEFAFGNSWIEITQDGKFKITNGAVELLDRIDAALQALINSTVVTPSGPGSIDPGTLATLATIKAQIDTLKG